VLDADVVPRVDLGPPPAGESREVRGARAVAGQALFYARLGLLIHTALVHGAAGIVSILDGQPYAVGGITVRGGRSPRRTSSPTPSGSAGST
jgi:RNA polymerase sigma-70 factor (ECF subfamily)